jgi:hypothetical protein
MHSFPCPDNEDAFYITGRAQLIEDQTARDALAKQFVHERSRFWVQPPATAGALLEFDIDSCLTRTVGPCDPAPNYVVWGTVRFFV